MDCNSAQLLTVIYDFLTLKLRDRESDEKKNNIHQTQNGRRQRLKLHVQWRGKKTVITEK